MGLAYPVISSDPISKRIYAAYCGDRERQRPKSGRYSD
jgi:hypothetical protein